MGGLRGNCWALLPKITIQRDVGSGVISGRKTMYDKGGNKVKF